MVATTQRGNSWRAVRLLAIVTMQAMLCLPLVMELLGAVPALRLDEGRPLYGEVRPQHPPFSLASVGSGVFQQGIADRIEHNLFPRKFIVRLTNQIYYDLFAKSYMYFQAIIIGRNHTLFEKAYIYSYCGASPTAFRTLRKYIRGLAALNTHLKEIGRPMVVVITPSKAVTMPELLPDGVCPQPSPDPAAITTSFVDRLRRAGVTVVDGASTARSMKRTDPLPPFPPGGTHWTAYAAQQVAAEVMHALDRSGDGDFGGIASGPVRFDVPPEGSDKDLAELLNLYRPPVDYPIAKADLVCRDTPTGGETSLMVVGGSFAGMLVRAVSHCKLFRSVLYYNYYSVLVSGGVQRPVEAGKEDLRTVFAGKTALLVELNEIFLGGGSGPWLGPFLKDARAALKPTDK